MFSKAVILINSSRLTDVVALLVGGVVVPNVLHIFGALAGLAVVFGMTEVSGAPSFHEMFHSLEG